MAVSSFKDLCLILNQPDKNSKNTGDKKVKGLGFTPAP
jgi:hypothetical protein